MAIEGAKPRPKRAVGGKPINRTERPKGRGKRRDTGVVESRGAAGATHDAMPSKRTIRTGAGGQGAGFDRGSKLRGGMRKPKGWREQLRDYHGVTF